MSNKARHRTWCIAAAALAYVAVTQQSHAINKCTNPGGKVTFQDAPCANKGEKLDIRPSSGTGDAAATADAQGRLATMRADNEMAAAIREKRPLIGMTVKQLNEAMGLATLVNTDTSTGTAREQAIFERPHETWYVYTRNGRVEYLQQRPGPPAGHGASAATRTTTGRCPSAHEINNAITSASSISLGPDERAARMKQIKAMQDCR